MVNNTRKAVISAFALIAGSSLFAGRDANIVNACSFGGQTVTVSGGACTTGDITQGGGAQISAPAGASGRARGDIGRMNLQGLQVHMIQTRSAGNIQVPQVGQIALYGYGQNELVVATFSLKNENLNPNAIERSNVIKRIIRQAASKYPWAETMVWVGQVTPGQGARNNMEVVEVTETVTNLQDMSKVESIPFEGLDEQALEITIPATRNAKSASFVIDFKPINKESAR